MKPANRTSFEPRIETEDEFRREDYPTVALVYPGVPVRTFNSVTANDSTSKQPFETEDGYRPSDYPICPLLYSGSARYTPKLGTQLPFCPGRMREKTLVVRQLKCRPTPTAARTAGRNGPSRYQGAPPEGNAPDEARLTDVPTWRIRGAGAADRPASDILVKTPGRVWATAKTMRYGDRTIGLRGAGTRQQQRKRK